MRKSKVGSGLGRLALAGALLLGGAGIAHTLDPPHVPVRFEMALFVGGTALAVAFVR